MDPTKVGQIVARLSEQMARAEVSLFTGAGFSFGAKDLDGQDVPQVDALRREIWDLVWPDEPFDPESTLQDTYAAGLEEARSRVAELLRRRLRVDPDSLNEAHELWLSMPWRRAYTVNIDDLEGAAARRFSLPRSIKTYSALTDGLPLGTGGDLLFTHLNGTLDDVPDVTFTDPQYGRRHGQTNPLYEQLVAELLSYPVVFVGTTLRESLFWEYVTLRDERGARGVREMRPLSYLVAPTLPPDRQRLLATYNIRWVPLTAEQFAEQVLRRLEQPARAGLKLLAANAVTGASGVRLARVTDLTALPQPQPSEYLMGARPRWDDIRRGRAVERVFEEHLPEPRQRGAVVVTGTAGAGTSTTLMRLAMRLVGNNRDVRWIGPDHEYDARDLGRWLRRHEDDVVVVIDDADTFGRGLPELLTDARASRGNVLLAIGMRASQVDRLLPTWTPDDDERVEITVPLLADDDIERLLRALEEDNKLGVLKPLGHAARVERVQRECGRELLVAMFEATSGERFEVKIAEEFSQLEAEQRVIYAITAIATDLRAYLLKDEILMASGDLSNTGLYALDRLSARRLILEENGRYSLRHRRIAELIVSRLRNSAEMLEPYRGLLRTMATRYQARGQKSRELKLFSALLSHRRIGHTFSVADARGVYQDLEDVCREDYHYWLQRGSFEVQFGSLALARTWLSHAKDGGQHDHRVHTEWAYYLLKSARENPTASDAGSRVAEGQDILLDYMEGYGDRDSYPWHVYGSQMLGWSRAASLSDDERAELLRDVIARIETGVSKHRGDTDLRGLLKDLQNDLLSIAIPPPRRGR